MQKKYLDVILYKGDTTINISGSPIQVVGEEIHISMKDVSISSCTFAGMLHKKLSSGLFEEGSVATIFIDDIMQADYDSLLNPGILIMYAYEIHSFIPDTWKVVITKSIERESNKREI